MSNQTALYLHHSTGRNLIDEGSMRALFNSEHIDFWDQDYNHIGMRGPDGDFSGGNLTVPGDNLYPDGLATLFGTSNSARTTIENTDYDLVTFKSCYPAADITSSAMLAQYQSWYETVRDWCDSVPNTRILIQGFPPRHRLANASDSQAARARAFTDWLASSEFLSGHPNIGYFNLFDKLAYSTDSSTAPNRLHYDHERNHYSTDSHPNTFANSMVGPMLANAIIDILRAERLSKATSSNVIWDGIEIPADSQAILEAE